jgi:BirA family biotin operon repressor/biotin-[acetyl-CoA-carboxylase] ligase
VNVPEVPDDIAIAMEKAAERAAFPLEIHWAPAVPSTMDVAADAARAGVAEGYVVVADTQTAGRGRRGRSWESPPGAGLYLSVVLRPPLNDTRTLALLTLTVGVAVRRAIQHATGLAAELKWPNDLVVSRRKLAGILAEGLDITTDAQSVIVGMGINVRRAVMSDEVSARATSLEEELGRDVSRACLLEAVLVDAASAYDGLKRGGADDILREWTRASPSAVGATVEWDSSEGTRRGLTSGVDRDGALLVRVNDSTERVVGGVVRWR